MQGVVFLLIFLFLLSRTLEPVDFNRCSFQRDPVSVIVVAVVNKLGDHPLQFLRRQLLRTHSQLFASWNNGHSKL